MKIIAFFNNKGGVGKTTLVYHLAHMYAELGIDVAAIDLDPQSNLTSMFLPEERLEELWPKGKHPHTIHGAITPILRGLGGVDSPHVESINEHLGLVPGDLGLSSFEDKLSDAWPRCHNRDEAAFRTMTAFHQVIFLACKKRGAELALVDVGPNLGAINRSALIASDHVVIPVASDLFSLQGLQNLGPQLRDWRKAWNELLSKNPDPDLRLPGGSMQPAGYVAMQHAVRADRPVKAYLRWMDKIPGEYQESVLDLPPETGVKVENDRNCLALLKHYRSLVPLAMEARKPMFFLKPADGALGAHGEAVQSCYRDFERLAQRILTATRFHSAAIK